MNKENKNFFGKTGCLTLEQIMDYVHDRLSMKDRNRVERHMQDCAFCAEAMEGFLLTEGKEERTAAIVSEIHQSITGKVAEKKIRWMVAASFALAVLAGGVVYLNSQLSPSGQDTEVAVRGKDKNADTVKFMAPEVIGNLKDADTSSLALKKNQMEGEKLSYTLNAPEVNKQLLQEYETISDGYLPSAEEEVKEEKPVEIDRSADYVKSLSAGNAVIKDSIAPSSNYYRIEPREEEYADKYVIAESGKKKDVAKADKNIQEKTKKKKMSTSDYRTKSAGEISLSDDFGEREDAKVSVKTVKDGIDNYKAKNYKEASLILEEVLKVNPDSEEALYYNGLSHYELKNYDKAIVNFDKIKKGSTFYEDALQMKAKAYLAKGEKEKAKEVLQQIVQAGGKHKSWAEEELKGD